MTENAIRAAHSQGSLQMKALLQHNLSVRLAVRFENVGLAQDLDKAQHINSETLASVRYEGYYRAQLLINRARIASIRFKQSHFWKDLEEAKNSAKEAINLKPTDPLTLVVLHQNLAVFHLQSFEIVKSALDLRMAQQHAWSARTQSKKIKLYISSAQETLLQYYQTALLHTGKMAELQGLLDVLQEQIDRLPKLSPRTSKQEQYLNLLALNFQHTGDHTDLIFLCHKALQSLRMSSRGDDAKTTAEKERLTDALSYLLGEVYRYLLIPEFFHVRDGFLTALHKEYFKYKHEDALGALESMLRRSEVFSFRSNLYGKDGNRRSREVLDHMYEISVRMGTARMKARTEKDPIPLSQFRSRLMDIGINMPKTTESRNIGVQEARDALFSRSSDETMNLPEQNIGTDAVKHHQVAGALLNQAQQQTPKDQKSLSILLEALENAKKAINGFPAGEKEHLDALARYITICQAKHNLGRDRTAPNEDLVIVENALETLPQSALGLFLQLELCQIRRTRYLRTEEVDDLNRATAVANVLVAEEFVNTNFSDQPYWFERVSIACQVFRTRYQQLSDTATLDHGIMILRKALRYA